MLMLAFVAVMAVNAKQVVFDFTNPEALGITAPAVDNGTPINDSIIVVDSVTMTNVKVARTDNRIYNSKGVYDLRIYATSTLTFAADTAINAVEFDGAAVGFNEMLGTTWFGAANTVTFTANMTNKISKIIIYIGEQPERWIPDTISVSYARALIDSSDAHTHFVKGVVAGAPYITYSDFSGKVNVWLTDELQSADSIQAYQIFDKNNAKWASLDAAKEELGVGDTILVYAGKLELYSGKYEINGGYYAEKLGDAPDAPLEGDTVSVAQAVAIAESLPANKTTEENYFVEGYAVDVQPYSTQYKNQMFYLADDTVKVDSIKAPVLKAYRANPKKDGAAYPVLAGDKLRLYGPLQKYVKDSTTQPELEIVDASVEFLAEVEGDRTIVIPTADTITVAQALEIGKTLQSSNKDNKYPSDKEYVIKGYSCGIVEQYTEQYKNETFWISDVKGTRTTDKAVAFEVYRGKPNTEKEIGYDALVQFRCKIMNFGGTIENYDSNMAVEVLEQGDLDPLRVDTISVEQALEIGQALEKDATTDKEYLIQGYVSYIQTAYDSQYMNETFWITDKKGKSAKTNKDGAFEVYRGKPDIKAEIGAGAYVYVQTKIQNYKGNTVESVTGAAVTVIERGDTSFNVVDTISVAKALEIGQALEENEVTLRKYAIEGYVSAIDNYLDTTYKNETFWITDSMGNTFASNDEGAFYVYRGKPSTGAEMGYNAKVRVVTTIKKYAKSCSTPVIENETANVPVEVLEQGEEEQIDTITVARAIEIGAGITNATKNRYVITGYVSSIETPFSEQYENETFWISDDSTSTASSNDEGAFEIYRGKPIPAREIGLHAKIQITCKIKNYYNTIENDGVNISFTVLEAGQELKIDTLTVEQAMAIGDSLADNAYSGLYVVKGYVTKAYAPDSCKTAQTFFMADEPDVKGAFEAYKASPDSLVVDGDYVMILGKIQKYVGSKGTPTIEMSYGNVTHIPAPQIDTLTVAEAIEIGNALEEGAVSDRVVIVGYVASIEDNSGADDGFLSFTMVDNLDIVGTGFKAIDAYFAEKLAEVNDNVRVVGKISKTDGIIMIKDGAARVLTAEGIENIVLTESAKKVLIEGNIYIIRDNKIFTIQGVQVR